MAISHRVLVLDPDTEVRAKILDALAEVPCLPLEASKFAEALELAITGVPDIAIIGSNLPGDAAFRLIDELVRNPATRNATVLLLASRQDKARVLAAMEKQVDDVLWQPWDADELRARVHAHLRRKDSLDGMWRAVEDFRTQREAYRTRCLRLVAHDLNNPLTAIRILAEMLSGELEDTETRDDLMDVLEAADLAGSIVESMTALLHLDAPQEEHTWVPVDLADIIRRVAKRPCMRRIVDLQLGSDDSFPVRGNPRIIQQALCDVLLNGRQLCEGTGNITITATATDREASLLISHPAPRLPERLRHRLIEMFGAVDIRRERLRVSAVGLTYAAWACRLHGGRLELLGSGEDHMAVRLTISV